MTYVEEDAAKHAVLADTSFLSKWTVTLPANAGIGRHGG
jgi:hypothetical protein